MAANARNVILVRPDAESGMATPTLSQGARADHVGPEGAGFPDARAHRISAHPKTELWSATELWPNVELRPDTELRTELCTADAHEPASLCPATSHGDWTERWTRDGLYAHYDAVWKMWACPTLTPKHVSGCE